MGCTGLSERNVVKENVGDVCFLKVIQLMCVGAYVAMLCMPRDYNAMWYIHIDYIGHKALG